MGQSHEIFILEFLIKQLLLDPFEVPWCDFECLFDFNFPRDIQIRNQLPGMTITRESKLPVFAFTRELRLPSASHTMDPWLLGVRSTGESLWNCKPLPLAYCKWENHKKLPLFIKLINSYMFHALKYFDSSVTLTLVSHDSSVMLTLVSHDSLVTLTLVSHDS